MLNIIKKYAATILGAIAILSAAVVPVEADAAPDSSHIKKVGDRLPMTGETVTIGTNKYDVYAVDGDLEDLNWTVNYGRGQEAIADGDSLVRGMPFADPADLAAKRIQCGFICKAGDKVIGIHPGYKKVYYPAKKK